MTTPIAHNEHGDETHPSFGVVKLSRVTASPGMRLFDSSIPHTEFVTMTIQGATRKRDLHRDWVYPNHRPLIEVAMSMTQWGALVSSFGAGSGTPVTLEYVNGERVPRAEHESRLAETAREVADAARKSTEQVREAAEAVLAAFDAKAGRRDMGAAVRSLQHAVQGLPNNMRFAADTLTRHAEDVVSKATADIEAARQSGTDRLAQPFTLPDLAPTIEIEDIGVGP